MKDNFKIIVSMGMDCNLLGVIPILENSSIINLKILMEFLCGRMGIFL